MNKYFEIILAEAAKGAALGEVPVGALVLRKGEVLAVAHNERETTQQLLTHAELLAMERATRRLGSWRLSGCTLFSTLEPCLMCLAAASQARIKQIVFGAKDPKGGALSLGYRIDQDARIPHHIKILFIDVPECRELLQEFFQSLRRNKTN